MQQQPINHRTEASGKKHSCPVQSQVFGEMKWGTEEITPRTLILEDNIKIGVRMGG